MLVFSRRLPAAISSRRRGRQGGNVKVAELTGSSVLFSIHQIASVKVETGKHEIP
jgi:hypothetical protein